MKKILIPLLFLFSVSSLAQTTIYLVRHAEKVIAKDDKDPGLTQIGEFRAKNIANQLSSVGITHVFSTDYKRTMQTAAPLAKKQKLDVRQYNPKKLKEFALELKKIKGTILVVGHSNTTSKLTKLLSGREVNPISENEYDNLYQVIIHDEKVILNRFKTLPASPPMQVIRIQR